MLEVEKDDDDEPNVIVGEDVFYDGASLVSCGWVT